MRKKSTTTQLKEALAAKEAAEKALTQANSMKDIYNKQASDRAEEIAGVHAFLDAMGTPKHPEGESYRTYTLMTRLAVWMAMKS